MSSIAGLDYRISDAEFASARKMLADFVSIPSISHPTSPYFSMETLQKAADFASERLQEVGMNVRQVSIDGSAPYVLAEKIVDPGKPTMVLYGHYDLQPVEEACWESEPFVLTERNGRLYGRGASDDKAGVVAIITALGVCMKQWGTTGVNVKVLLEGEEEYNSSHMDAFLKQEKESLKGDAFIIMDGGVKDVNTGTLSCSTRGVVNLTMQVHTMRQSAHSGVGCLLPDPSLMMAKLMVSLEDPAKIDGFLENRERLSSEEKRILEGNSQSRDEYANAYGLVSGQTLRGDDKLSVYERIAEEPSISFLNGNWGKPNGGNSIQSDASCEIGVRLTAGQDPDLVVASLMKHLQSVAAKENIPLEVAQKGEGSHAWKADLTAPITQKYLAALKEVFGQIDTQPCGGTIPLLRSFKEAFPDMEMLLAGVEDPQTNAHSHNESQDIGLFRKTIDSLVVFLQKSEG